MPRTHYKPAALLAFAVFFAFAGILKTLSFGQAAGGESTTLKYEEPTLLKAAIYGADRKELLFRFTRRATRSGSTLNVVREYSYPDGKLATRERIVYQGDDLVSYTVGELQTGGAGGAKIQREQNEPDRGSISFNYRKDTDSKLKTHTEDLAPDTINADMLAPFVVSHWKSLMEGAKVRCRYIVLHRRETVGFSFAKDSESTRQGKPVIIIKMEPTSLIISALVDPVYFAIEKEGRHHVLEYSGRTTPKARDGNKWKDLDAVTVFDWGQ